VEAKMNKLANMMLMALFATFCVSCDKKILPPQPVSAGPMSPNSAAITLDSSSSFPFIAIKGDIDAQTPIRLEAALKYVQPLIDKNDADGEKMFHLEKGQLSELMGAWLALDSGGGDVDAAIKAGEIARKYHVTTRVLNDATCASACVLLLVGGVDRIIYGKVGIHRPFSAGYSSSISESGQRYKSINTSVEGYLRAMNMPPRLMDAMNAIPPDQIQWLTEDQMQEFGINASDPIWKDRNDSVSAQERGISKQEYYSRLQRAREECKSIPAAADEQFSQCYNNIVGLPR
jgi:hypothetical protein